MICKSMNSLRHTSPNKRVSGYGASHLRPNPRFARTSDTRHAVMRYGRLQSREITI